MQAKIRIFPENTKGIPCLFYFVYLLIKKYKQMKQKDIGTYYVGLENGQKGRFTAFVSLMLGGSPSSWQHKFILWAKDRQHRPLSPIIANELGYIITEGRWKP